MELKQSQQAWSLLYTEIVAHQKRTGNKCHSTGQSASSLMVTSGVFNIRP